MLLCDKYFLLLQFIQSITVQRVGVILSVILQELQVGLICKPVSGYEEQI